MEFVVEIENGRVINSDLQKYIKSRKNWHYIIDVRTGRERTLLQNSYYWSLVQILADDKGYTPDQMHEELRILFLSKPVEVTGLGVVLVAKSTTVLTTKEFTDYIEMIRQRAAMDGIILPDPQAQL